MDQLFAWLADAWAYLLANPLVSGLLLTCAVPSIIFIADVARQRYDRASVALILALGIANISSYGYDIEFHSSRLIELRTQLDAGALDLFFDTGGNAVPVFYYYSPAIYLLALPFHYLGLNAFLSVSLIGAIFFLVMGFGARRLFNDLMSGRDDAVAVAAIVTIVFVTSNYIYLNFSFRSAYPEAAAYALVPWVALALRSGSWLLPIGLVVLQIAIHPVVFPQAALATLVAYLAFRPDLRRALFLRVVGIYGIAVCVSAPAWAFAFVNIDAILGGEGTPVSFEDTFLPLSTVLSPGALHAPGPYILLLVLASVAWCGLKLGRGALLFAAAALILILQLEIARPITMQIPFADVGLFISRWMFVAVWLGALGICAAWCWRRDSRVLQILVLLAGVQGIFLGAERIRAPQPDAEMARYLQPTNAGIGRWAYGEFYPRYSGDLILCAELSEAPWQAASFWELRNGGVTSPQTLAVAHAPIGNVTYMAAEHQAETVGCGDTLFIRHPQPGQEAAFRAVPDWIGRHPEVRVFFPLLPLFLIGIAALARRPRIMD